MNCKVNIHVVNVLPDSDECLIQDNQSESMCAKDIPDKMIPKRIIHIPTKRMDNGTTHRI